MLSGLERGLLVALFTLLMFGMGARLRVQDFASVARTPRAWLIGTLAQFAWMPLCAFLLAKLLQLPAAAAVGLIVLAACPAGATSNLFAQIARGDLALSLSMTASSKLLGIGLMPLCLFLYARPFTGAELEIPYAEIAQALAALSTPVALAMYLRYRLGERFARIAGRAGTFSGALALLVLIAVGLTRNAQQFAQVSTSMCAAAISLGTLGLASGGLAARLAGLTPAQVRTVSFEAGVANPPLCLAILLGSFRAHTSVEMLAVPLLSQLFTLISASLLALYFRSRGAPQIIPRPAPPASGTR